MTYPELCAKERTYHRMVQSINTSNGVRFLYWDGHLVASLWHVPTNAQWAGPYKPRVGWHLSCFDQSPDYGYNFFQSKQDAVDWLRNQALAGNLKLVDPTFAAQRQRLYADTGVMPYSPYDSLAGYVSQSVDPKEIRYALDSRFNGIAAD